MSPSSANATVSVRADCRPTSDCPTISCAVRTSKTASCGSIFRTVARSDCASAAGATCDRSTITACAVDALTLFTLAGCQIARAVSAYDSSRSLATPTTRSHGASSRGIMCRTVLPPLGIFDTEKKRWSAGSKPMSVFGCGPCFSIVLRHMIVIEVSCICEAERLRGDNDALHIAIAAVHGIEFLATWNCKHIANAMTLPLIYDVCRVEGYEPPLICTPHELLGDSYDEEV